MGRLVLRIGLSAGVLLACGGCALLPLATIGTIFGMAGTAVSAAPEVYSAGKLDAALRVDDGDCRRAVRRAAADLQLRIVRDQKRSGGRQRWDFELQDDRKSEIEITVEKRSAMLCWCRVDVGLFGSEPTARLVMQVIESHLPPSATGPSGG
ncbi:MAG TPA: DUF3568 family protein [Tepidisphaeraceae bacterium]|nr:DUF3568 family protein [Tepidisphaeraceae bacterium]